MQMVKWLIQTIFGVVTLTMTKWVKPNFLTTTKSSHPVSTNTAKLWCVKQNYLGFWVLKLHTSDTDMCRCQTEVINLVLALWCNRRKTWLRCLIMNANGRSKFCWFFSAFCTCLAFLDDCISSVLLFGGKKRNKVDICCARCQEPARTH